ncbi:MAG: hypothetical protein DRI86_06425 [Bacteroidetes bacterium]|nr:MAG: hypothetical protein DRI86_06425 [Bacteroidota bacterium]
MIHKDSIVNFSDSLSNISSQIIDTSFIEKPSNSHIKEAIELMLDPINSMGNNWIFYWLSLIGVLIFLSKSLFPKHFNNIIQALINNRAYNNLTKEGIVWRHPLNIILTSAYILSISLVLFTRISHSLNINLDIYYALKIVLSIIILIFTKLIIVLFTQVVFQIKSLLSNYLNYLFLSYSFLGIILFFFLWILLYADYQFGVYISAILTTMVYLFRIYKLLSLRNSKNNFNLFHFIIYLCTVEILPLVIFRKLYFIWFLGN